VNLYSPDGSVDESPQQLRLSPDRRSAEAAAGVGDVVTSASAAIRSHLARPRQAASSASPRRVQNAIAEQNLQVAAASSARRRLARHRFELQINALGRLSAATIRRHRLRAGTASEAAVRLKDVAPISSAPAIRPSAHLNTAQHLPRIFQAPAQTRWRLDQAVRTTMETLSKRFPKGTLRHRLERRCSSRLDARRGDHADRGLLLVIAVVYLFLQSCAPPHPAIAISGPLVADSILSPTRQPARHGAGHRLWSTMRSSSSRTSSASWRTGRPAAGGKRNGRGHRPVIATTAVLMACSCRSPSCRGHRPLYNQSRSPSRSRSGCRPSTR